MTHDELVERAGRWLRNTRQCKIVLLEAKPPSCDEHPDAIGWLSNGESLVVECKASLDDLRRDANKRWRRHNSGMGFCRYYMISDKLIEHPLVPPGEGLLVVRGRRVIVQVEASPRQDRDWTAEI